jgi:hypothetical protein
MAADGWKNTGADERHWQGWGTANDRVIDRSVGRPWSWCATRMGRRARARIRNHRDQLRHGSPERRRAARWN